MQISTKINELKRQQNAYLDYLNDHSDDILTTAHKVSICQEIDRIDALIKEMAELPIFALKLPYREGYKLEFTSALIKPRTPIKKITQYTFSTWKLSS